MKEQRPGMGGIVLAGGKSERMGRDKALIELNGRCLIDIVCEKVSEVTRPVVVVGGNRNETPSIPDLFPGEGPLGGLITGLEHLGQGRHLAVACDMPFVSPALMRALLDRLDCYDAVIPTAQDRLQPLCAAYNGDCAVPLRRAYASGERSLTAAIDWIRAFIFPEIAVREIDPSLRSLMNINSEAEFQRAQQLDIHCERPNAH